MLLVRFVGSFQYINVYVGVCIVFMCGAFVYVVPEAHPSALSISERIWDTKK